MAYFSLPEAITIFSLPKNPYGRMPQHFDINARHITANFGLLIDQQAAYLNF